LRNAAPVPHLLLRELRGEVLEKLPPRLEIALHCNEHSRRNVLTAKKAGRDWSAADVKTEISLPVDREKSRRVRLASLREIQRVIQSLPRAAAKKVDADIVKQIELRSLHQTFRRLAWPDSPIMLQCSQTEIIKTPIIRRSNFAKIRRHDDFTQRLPKMKPPPRTEFNNWEQLESRLNI